MHLNQNIEERKLAVYRRHGPPQPNAKAARSTRETTAVTCYCQPLTNKGEFADAEQNLPKVGPRLLLGVNSIFT